MKNRNDIWKLGEDLKGGTSNKTWAFEEPKEKKTFAKKMPEEGRSKGTWGGGYSRP